MSCLLCLGFYILNAQNIDSLKLALKAAKHDTVRVSILLNLIETISDDNVWPKFNQEAYLLSVKLSQSSQPAERHNGVKGLAATFNNMGYLAYQNGKIREALEYYDKSAKYHSECGDKVGLGDLLNNIGAIHLWQGHVNEALIYYNQSLNVRKSLSDKRGVAESLKNIASLYAQTGDIEKALDFNYQSLKISQEISDEHGIASIYNNIAAIFVDKGEIRKGLDYDKKGLAIAEKIGDKKLAGSFFNNIGFIYKDQNDYANALEYFKKGLALHREMGDKPGIATLLNNIGVVHDEQAKVKEALQYYQESLKIRLEITDKNGIAESYVNMGGLYSSKMSARNSIEQERFKDTALMYYKKSLALRKEVNDKRGMAWALNSIATVYIWQRKLNEAEKAGKESLQLSRELGFPDNIRIAALSLKDAYSLQGDFEKALEMYDLEIQMRDSITNTENQKAATRQKLEYEYEKKAAQTTAAFEKQKALNDAELEKQKLITYSAFGGGGLFLLFLLFAVKAYSNKRRINIMILKQKVEVERETRFAENQRQEAEYQKLLVEEKQKEILDSITYAKRIQTALITSERYISNTVNRLNKK